MTDRTALRAGLADLRGRVGAQQARWCVDHADGRAESPGESISRYEMIMGRIPMPDLQREIVLPSGTVARADFLWKERRLIGEFDGALKYRADDATGRGPQDVVWEEKLREDALRSLGYRVVRWTWSEVWRPHPWIDRLRSLVTGLPIESERPPVRSLTVAGPGGHGRIR